MDGRRDKDIDNCSLTLLKNLLFFFGFSLHFLFSVSAFILGVASVIFFFLVYVFVIAGESQIVCFVIARQLLVF